MIWKSWKIIVCVLVIFYLVFGAYIYSQGLRSRRSIHICSPLPVESTDWNQVSSDCPNQEVSIVNELPTALFVITTWLPLVLARTWFGEVIYQTYFDLFDKPQEVFPLNQ